MTNKAWEDVLGDWPKDATDAKVKDPTLDAGIFGQVTSVPMWGKLLNKGLRSYIEEAQGHIDAFRARARKPRSTSSISGSRLIIVCEAIINHARRYAELAREMAVSEKNPARKAQLLEIADVCMRVPEYPARSFHEALQSMAIVAACKVLEHPMHNNPHWGRGDQYLYPFFIRDVTEGKISLDGASELLAELIGRWGTQIFVTNETQRESHQINFGINNVLLGGLTQSGEDGSNELSYLFLHMVGPAAAVGADGGRALEQENAGLDDAARPSGRTSRDEGRHPAVRKRREHDQALYGRRDSPMRKPASGAASGASTPACRPARSTTARRAWPASTWRRSCIWRCTTASASPAGASGSRRATPRASRPLTTCTTPSRRSTSM